MENVNFALKSTVEALDPAWDIWLTCKVTDVKEGELFKWKNYDTSDWLKESFVRNPLQKGSVKLSLEINLSIVSKRRRCDH